MFLWSYMPWPVASFTIISAFLAVVLNVTQLPIILFRSSSAIGNYKILLALYNVSIIVFSVIQFIQVPAFTVGEEGFVFHSTSIIVNRPWCYYSLATYISCYIQIAIILNLSYIYRYAALDRSSFLSKYFRYPHVIGTTTVSLSLWFYVLLICLLYMRPNDYRDQLYFDRVYELYGVYVNVSGYTGGPLYTDGHINYGMFLVITTFALLVIVTVIVVSTMTFKILRKIRLASEQGSLTAKKMHQQIFNLLVLQSVFPVVFTFLPAFVGFVLALLSVRCDDVIKYMGSLMTLGLICHPLLVYYYISEYRKVLLTVAYRMFNVKTSITISNVSITPTRISNKSPPF